MIIDQMTLRIKNIIFFKTVCVFFGYILISYAINTISDSYVAINNQNEKAKQMLTEAEERLKALNNQNNELTEAISKYKSLQTVSQKHFECFDKFEYQKNIRNIEKNFKLGNQAGIYISSSSAAKKNQPTRTVLLKTTTVKINYSLDKLLDAINFAKEVYKTSPQYSLIRSFHIEAHDSITPNIAKLLDTSNDIDLVSSELTMEVREIDLNAK